MPKVTIYDMTGKSVGERDLSDAVFGIVPNKVVLHAVIKNYLAHQRRRNESALATDYEEEPPMFPITDTHSAATWLLDPRAPAVRPPVGGGLGDG